MNKLKYVVTILAALTISSFVTANEIKMAKANWDTGYFQAEVYKQALEKNGVQSKRT
jgi:ABC-type proline/glycine betaine transport system substrate-binding protein